MVAWLMCRQAAQHHSKEGLRHMEEDVILQIRVPISLYVLSAIVEAMDKIDHDGDMMVSSNDGILTMYREKICQEND
jgi:hypothetical protein